MVLPHSTRTGWGCTRSQDQRPTHVHAILRIDEPITALQPFGDPDGASSAYAGRPVFLL
jgi:hypothetical protein